MIRKVLRLVGLTLIVAVALVAAVIPESRLALSADGERFPATLTIRTEEGVTSFLSYEKTLLKAIDTAGIIIGDNHRLSLPEETDLEPGGLYDVTIRSMVSVSLTWGGYSLETVGLFSSMSDLLDRSGFSRLEPEGGILSGDDSADDESYVLSYVEIEKKLIHQPEEIPFSSVTLEDSTLYAGKTTVKVAGKTGIRNLIYEETYEDGIFVSSVQIGSEVVREPVQEVILKGTKPKPTYAPINYRTLSSTVRNSLNKIKDYLNPQGGNKSYQNFSDNGNGTITIDGRTFRYNSVKKRTLTMYDGLECCLQGGCHTPAINHKTFSGVPAQRGLVATFGVKANGRYTGTVLPMGTILFVEGYGLGVVADIHGVSGNPDLVDLCFDPGDCRNGVATIGKRVRRVYILNFN